ncbi:MAG TPA: hypothetical protein VII73_00860 [Caulobacteraceae bacterium]
MVKSATPSPAERAERFSRKRTTMLWLEVALFGLWQTVFLVARWTSPHGPRAGVTTDVLLWMTWVVVLLLLIGTGGGTLMSREVRRLVNDEVSTANRHEGQRWGFWAAMLVAIAVYLISIVQPAILTYAIHAVVSFGIGAALIRYAWLERRADRAA